MRLKADVIKYFRIVPYVSHQGDFWLFFHFLQLFFSLLFHYNFSLALFQLFLIFFLLFFFNRIIRVVDSPSLQKLFFRGNLFLLGSLKCIPSLFFQRINISHIFLPRLFFYTFILIPIESFRTLFASIISRAHDEVIFCRSHFHCWRKSAWRRPLRPTWGFFDEAWVLLSNISDSLFCWSKSITCALYFILLLLQSFIIIFWTFLFIFTVLALKIPRLIT